MEKFIDKLQAITDCDLHSNIWPSLVPNTRPLSDWRQERTRRIIENCANQPAGTPVMIEGDSILADPILARGYGDQYYRRPRHISQEEQRRKSEEYMRQREKRLAKMPPEERYKHEKFNSWFWFTDNDREWSERRSWFSSRLGAWVCIMEHKTTKKCKLSIRERYRDECDFKGSLYFNTWHAAKIYKLEAETRAMELLRTKVTPEQYTKYFCTGMLIERSKKTTLTYIFRRARPVLVYREPPPDCEYGRPKFVCALCVHAQGYYMATWAGTLVPTDDLIAQLLFMRADEKGLWHRSIQHGRRDPCADI